MHLKILLPDKIFIDVDGLTRLVVPSTEGFLGILPHRLDFVAALHPGILFWQTASGVDIYAAVDEGVMSKTGGDVVCSVRNAVTGVDLGQLNESIKQQFLNLSAQEKLVRTALAKLEVGLTRKLAEFQHG